MNGGKPICEGRSSTVERQCAAEGIPIHSCRFSSLFFFIMKPMSNENAAD